MWRTLFDGPFPDAHSTLPPELQDQAAQAIRRYWLTHAWQLVLGQFVVWWAAHYRSAPHPEVYLGMALIITVAYLLAVQSIVGVWLLGTLMLFGLQGILIGGLGAVTSLSFMVPYTIASMTMSGRRRLFVQAACAMAFWGNLLYEILPVLPRIQPTDFILVSYNILIAAFTFQTLRYLNRYAVEINADYVSSEVRMQSHRFLARVSHELRTPLSSTLGFSKMLRRADLPDKYRLYLEKAIEEGEHLNHLVSDLLDSAHLSTGKLTLNKDDCDVNAICQAVTDEHRPTLSQAVALQADFASDMPVIQADARRLRQAIGNLLANAIKHTEQGTITVRSRCHDDHIFIDIADTGSGISEEQQKLIFVPFVQLDTRRAGVGLGLDIAQQLVRLHGGDIRLRSVVGEGSTFTIDLPLNPA
jgi:signal transduction histidine kinase